MIREFEYFAPKTVEEALSLLSQYKEEAKIIAGGQSMLVVMKQGLLDTEYLIDIKGVSALDYINFDGGKGLRIGVLTTHRAIEKSPVTPSIISAETGSAPSPLQTPPTENCTFRHSVT